MLSDLEKSQAAQAVRDLILGAGLVARQFRAMGPGLYGSDDEEAELVGEIHVELLESPDVDVGNNVDAVANVLPGAGVQPTDRLVIAGATYRVQAIKPHNLFGIITHLELSLVVMR